MSQNGHKLYLSPVVEGLHIYAAIIQFIEEPPSILLSMTIVIYILDVSPMSRDGKPFLSCLIGY